MSETDLLGEAIRKRRDRAKGYAGRVGAGPKGQTCGTCRHVAVTMADWGAPKRLICGLVRHERLGPSSAVKRAALACQHWESQ